MTRENEELLSSSIYIYIYEELLGSRKELVVKLVVKPVVKLEKSEYFSW